MIDLRPHNDPKRLMDEAKGWAATCRQQKVEIKRLRAALTALHEGLAWDWLGHPVGDLPTLREIARTALEGGAV